MMEVKIKLIKNYNKVEPDELCPLIMQLALNDGKKEIFSLINGIHRLIYLTNYKN